MLSFRFGLFIGIPFLCALVEAEFPVDPKPCKYGDSECIVRIANYFLHEKGKEGDNAINLPKMEPLRVKDIKVRQGAQGPVDINLNFTNNKILGLGNIKIYKVKGFDKDIQKQHEVRFNASMLSLISDYTIKGQILVLPINGNGKSNMSLVDTDVGMTFMAKSYEKDGETYLRAYDLKLKDKPKRMYIDFDNLFNGDKILSDSMNAFLNENWEAVYDEIQVVITTALEKIFEALINKIFKKYPYEKFFEQ